MTKGSRKSPKARDSSTPTLRVTNNVNNDVEDLADATSKVRKQIVKWQHGQNDVRLKQLKEHKDYEVQIERSLYPNGMFKAAIFCCMCAKKVHLGVTESTVKLSNWVRHVKSCTQEKKPKTEKQKMLTKYLCSTDSASVSSPQVSDIPSSVKSSSAKSDSPSSAKSDSPSSVKSDSPSSVSWIVHHQ